MTVGELIDKLAEWGPYLPVTIMREQDGENFRPNPIMALDDTTVDGDLTVVIWIP